MRTEKATQKRSTRLSAILLALLLLLSSLSLLSACGSKKVESASNYIRTNSKGDKLEMRVTLTETGLDTVGLFAIESWQTAADIQGMTPLLEVKVKDNVVDLKYDISGELTSSFCRGYLLGKAENSGYKPVSGVFYVSNPRDIHKTKSDENAPLGNIKGAIASPSQLLDLGAASTVVTVDLSEIMAPEGGIGTIGYIRNGYSCYVNRSAIERLDEEIKGYTSAGIYVFLELVQTKPASELPDTLKCIAYPTATDARGYAFNMSNREGATKICGIFDFLAKRYAAGSEYGRAEAFIIGRNVNNYTKYFAGESSPERSARNYMAAVRAAYNTLLTHTPNGRVYVAIDNNWNVSNYNARDFLSTAAAIVDDGGDFYWQVSIEANPSNGALSSIWADDLGGETPNFISPANIEVLSGLLNSAQFTCNAMKRNILLNRFSVGGTDEEARAASYAYAYYKCLDTVSVDGLIYARYADSAEDPLKNGLCTAAAPGKPSEHKLIADIFTSIDCYSDGQVLSVGKSAGTLFEKMYGDHRYKAKRQKLSMVGESQETGEDGYKVFTDFSGGDLFGFSALSASYVELRHYDGLDRPILHARLTPSSSADSAGVISGELKLSELKGSGFIGITSMIGAVGTAEVDVTVRLSASGKGGTEITHVATSRASAGAWFEAYYDISEFMKEASGDEVSIAILVSPTDGGGSVSELWVSQITAVNPIKGGFPIWIIFVIIGVILAAAITVFVIWFRKHYTITK